MADTPAPQETQEGALPAGVTKDGASTTYTPQTTETGAEAPKVEEAPKGPPAGVDASEWAAFQAFKNKPAEEAPAEDGTKVETQGNEGEAPKTGIDLLVQESLAGVSPELAPKVEPFFRLFAEKGTLTDTEVTEAAKQTGFSEAMVRQYMAGGEAQVAASSAPFYELAGGKEGYAGFQAWANEALGPDDHAKINAAVEAGKASDIQTFVDAYKASGRAPAPRDVTANASTTNSNSAADVFTSTAQQSKAINDPRYKSDPEYRKGVEEKMMRSNV